LLLSVDGSGSGGDGAGDCVEPSGRAVRPLMAHSFRLRVLEDHERCAVPHRRFRCSRARCP